jgi:hypothetical protein
MGTKGSSFLRRISPLTAVLVILAPPVAHASSLSPDPSPGASGLRPDPSPAAAPAPTSVPRTPVQASTARPVVRTTVAPAPVRVVSTPAWHPPRVSRPVRARKPVTITHRQPRKRATDVVRKLELPPVLVPRLISGPLSQRPPTALAALALALAALTAASGAGLVFSWSRR